MTHLRAWQNLKRNWRFQSIAQLTTLSVLSASFIVLAMAGVIHQNLNTWLTQWGKNMKINVYLREESSDLEKKNIENFLNSSGYFSKVWFLSKSEALNHFKKRVGQLMPTLLSDLEAENPLPASFELEVKSTLTNSSQVNYLFEIANKIRSLTGVDEVSYGQGWLENYSASLRVFYITSWILISVLILGCLFVIGNSIRNSISQRRDEIEILELFGATRAMIIWPYIFEGLITGFIAAALAILTTYGLFSWQTKIAMEQLSFLSFFTKIEFLTSFKIALFIFGGTVTGGLGAFLWSRKYSTGWSAAEATL